MKRILGLDLGTSSIGWAVVDEAENGQEKSAIVDMGVRIVPLTVEEKDEFEKGKAITLNEGRRMKRSARRNLQRYKQRRANLIKVMLENRIIEDDTILNEDGPSTTFETYKNRAKAVKEEIGLVELARVLLMINKKRGYKSNRKVKKQDEEGALVDGILLSRKMQEEGLTPGQISLEVLKGGKSKLPSFYASDLKSEFDLIWEEQSKYYPEVLTEGLKKEVIGKTSRQTWGILADRLKWTSEERVWNGDLGIHENVIVAHTLQGLKRQTKGKEQKKENYEWRVSALKGRIGIEELAIVLQDINSQISSTSGYLGDISDRSKQLYFGHLTVGEYLWSLICQDSGISLKNIVFYRQDYIDEFNRIWDQQSNYHPELTEELKRLIRDRIIFYQRPLKSQKGRISICELERKEIKMDVSGKEVTKTIGRRVIPRSHPLFQEFRIWQTLNNIEVSQKGVRRKRVKKNQLTTDNKEMGQLTFDNFEGSRPLYQEEKQLLAEELSIKKGLTKAEVLKLLFENYRELDLNYDKIEGNHTGHALYAAYSEIVEECAGADPIDFKQPTKEIKEQLKDIFGVLGISQSILNLELVGNNKEIEEEEYYQLWHLLYSYVGDNTPTGYGKLLEILSERYQIPIEGTVPLANVPLEDEYGNLSAKAISKILPFLKEGNTYDVACAYAGYNHSRSSLTTEENLGRVLSGELEQLPKNTLRNPVVEKILNQMVNVVNLVAKRYTKDGHFDEIRVEMARELKKNAKQRQEATKEIGSASKVNDNIRQILQNEFGIAHVTRNDIIRYKLYEELKPNGYKTLYSNQYIEKGQLFSKEIDIEHIIARATLFDDSMSNKTLEFRNVNLKKGRMTAYDFVKSEYGEKELESYVKRCENTFPNNKTKLKKLLMTEEEIPQGFIERDLRNTQYIARKAMEMLKTVCRNVYPTVGEITSELRKQWQLIDVMKELNLPKYSALGQVETYRNTDGHEVRRIEDWTKRNDHRHHAVDALTVAFTRLGFVQYYNNINAQYDATSPHHQLISALRAKYFPKGEATPPMPLNELRQQTLQHLASILISIKAKNKVVTRSVNKIKTRAGVIKQGVTTPRGALHKETVYGLRKRYEVKIEKIDSSFDEYKIATVCDSKYRDALKRRLEEFAGDPKKAFTGKNSLTKNPIYTDSRNTATVPDRVRTVRLESYYTQRVAVDDKLKLETVVDTAVRNVLSRRLEEYNGDPKQAFVNLDKNPILFNGRSLKRVTIKARVDLCEAIHYKRDKSGQLIKDENGAKQPVDYVKNESNHLAAIFRRVKTDKTGSPIQDSEGNPVYEWMDRIVPFMEAVERRNQSLPMIDIEHYQADGWELYLTLKKNEYFLLPDQETGFNPSEVDLLNPENARLISPHLFRVQKMASGDYVFRNHIETTVEDKNSLRGKAWERFQRLSRFEGVIKVRIDHGGRIVESKLI